MNRREFAKITGTAALSLPLLPSVGAGFTCPEPRPESLPAVAQAPAQNEQPKPEPRLKLSKEQEEAVKKAVERRDRQLTAMRGRVLPYDAEPAFVFQVRQRPRSGRKT